MKWDQRLPRVILVSAWSRHCPPKSGQPSEPNKRLTMAVERKAISNETRLPPFARHAPLQSSFFSLYSPPGDGLHQEMSGPDGSFGSSRCAHGDAIGIGGDPDLLLMLATDRQTHRGYCCPDCLRWQPGSVDLDYHQLSNSITQESKGLGDHSTIGFDSKLSGHQLCECRHILDRQTDLAHMKYRGCPKGSWGLAVQFVMHDIFQDVAGRV